jgi:hypothetical protein
MLVGTADRAASGATLPFLRTRPRMRAPAALLSCIRGFVRRNGVLADEDFEVTATKYSAFEFGYWKRWARQVPRKLTPSPQPIGMRRLVLHGDVAPR